MPRRKARKGRGKGKASSKFGSDAVNRVFSMNVSLTVNTVTADGTTALEIYSELAGTAGFSEMSSVYRMVKFRKVSLVYQPVCQYPTVVGVNSAFHVVYDPSSSVTLPTTEWMLSNKNCKICDTNHRFTYSFKPLNLNGSYGPVDLAGSYNFGYFYAHIQNYSTPAPSNAVKVGNFAIRYYCTFFHQTTPLLATLMTHSPIKKEEKEELKENPCNKQKIQEIQIQELSSKVIDLERMIKELRTQGYDFAVVEQH